VGTRAATTDKELEVAVRAFMEQVQRAFKRRMAQLELTPPQAFALRHLDKPRSMRVLAEALHIDASTLTGIVDRLEERGLVERQPDLDDRRVKRLVLTHAGRVMRARFEEPLLDELPGLARLSASQRAQLAELLLAAFPVGAGSNSHC
jgi:DNA-binding MarR family transcriptional regulator